MFDFYFVFLNCLLSAYHKQCNNVVSPVCTVFVIHCWYSKTWDPRCCLGHVQFSTGILKFSTNHKDNPFTFNCSKTSWTFLFIFHAGSHGLGSKNFWNSNYKEKTTNLTRVSKIIFPLLITMIQSIHSWDAVNFRVLWPDWPHPFLPMPTQKYFDQPLIYMNLYKHAKNQAISLICAADVVD